MKRHACHFQIFHCAKQYCFLTTCITTFYDNSLRLHQDYDFLPPCLRYFWRITRFSYINIVYEKISNIFFINSIKHCLLNIICIFLVHRCYFFFNWVCSFYVDIIVLKPFWLWFLFSATGYHSVYFFQLKIKYSTGGGVFLDFFLLRCCFNIALTVIVIDFAIPFVTTFMTKYNTDWLGVFNVLGYSVGLI